MAVGFCKYRRNSYYEFQIFTGESRASSHGYFWVETISSLRALTLPCQDKEADIPLGSHCGSPVHLRRAGSGSSLRLRHSVVRDIKAVIRRLAKLLLASVGPALRGFPSRKFRAVQIGGLAQGLLNWPTRLKGCDKSLCRVLVFGREGIDEG